jgi:hypothetical protein
MKNIYEEKLGVIFSKNGIIKFIETTLELESANNKSNPKNSKLWEE